jgi:hypothetical protein
MPLPSGLQQLVATVRFWSDYFRDGVFEQPVGEPGDSDLELQISRRYALRVGYSFRVGGENYIEATSLTLRRADTGRDMILGWHDAHAFPHVLRWEEAALVGRLLARRDPDLPHPGVPFLLLVPYVASIEGTDHTLGLRLMNRALRSLGVFTEQQIRYRLSAFNRASAECEWRRVRPFGWVCLSKRTNFWENGGKLIYSLGKHIYSLRVPPAGSDSVLLDLPADVELHPEMRRLMAEAAANRPRFPFNEWNDCMRLARRAVARGPHPPAETAGADPLPPLSQHIQLCYQVTNSDAANATIPALRDALFREGLGVCHVFGSWSAFENQDDPHADLDHPNADAEYWLSCYGSLAEIVAVVRRVVAEAGRPEVRLYQRLDDEAGPPYRRIEL